RRPELRGRVRGDSVAHVVAGPWSPRRAGGLEGPLHAAAREHRDRDQPVPGELGGADAPPCAGGPRVPDYTLPCVPVLADDGPDAARDGAVQAGRSQRRPVVRFLSADGGPGVRRRRPADLARALAELRDEMGAARFRARRPAAALLGQFPGGAGLDRTRDAALPARLAAPPGGRGRAN